jgi:predicted DNA-binding transcriptional regulator AlpA
VSELLRFPDLQQYGVKNWPTFKRWVERHGAPAGFYLGANTRAWLKKDWDEWLANKAKAPPNIRKPRPSASTEGTGQTSEKTKHPLNSEPEASAQASRSGGAV